MRESRFSTDKDADFYYKHDPFYKPCKSGMEMSKGQELILIGFIVLMTIVAVAFSIIYVHKTIITNAYELEESKKINNQYKNLYNSVANIDEHLITKQEIENLKKYYEKEERDFQKAKLLEVETKLAKEICPVGSYVEIIETGTYVRVMAYEGFEAYTWDNINFNVAETDKWRFTDTLRYMYQCENQNRIAYIDKMIAKIVG